MFSTALILPLPGSMFFFVVTRSSSTGLAGSTTRRAWTAMTFAAPMCLISGLPIDRRHLWLNSTCSATQAKKCRKLTATENKEPVRQRGARCAEVISARAFLAAACLQGRTRKGFAGWFLMLFNQIFFARVVLLLSNRDILPSNSLQL